MLERSLALRRAYADEAQTRRQLDALFRDPAAVYRVEATRPKVRLDSPDRLQPVMTW